MKLHLEDLKAHFETFLKDRLEMSYPQRVDKETIINLNEEIFKFQNFIHDKLKEKRLNLLINPSIQSENITKSFIALQKPFSPNDFCLPFFDFLNVRKNEGKELHELIDEFIQTHKEELTWQDIMITATGATRCKTNIRFALDQLRGIKLISSLRENKDDKFKPTLLGEMIFFIFRQQTTQPVFDKNIKDQVLEHSIKIKESDFCKIFKIFNSLNDHSPNATQPQKQFWSYKKEQDDIEEVTDILKDIDEFLKNSIITETGIYLSKKKKGS